MSWGRMAMSCAFSGLWGGRLHVRQVNSTLMCSLRASSSKVGSGDTEIAEVPDFHSEVAKRVNRQMARRKVYHTSGELKKFLGGEDLVSLHDAAVAVISYAKQNKLMCGGNPANISLDNTLTKVIAPALDFDDVNMLKIPSLIKKTGNVRTPEGDFATRASAMESEMRAKLKDEAMQLFSKRAEREKKRARARGKMTDEQKSRAKELGTGFWRKWKMSADLISVVGKGDNGRMARPDIVKEIWSYIRANRLEISPAPSAASGVVISCDSKLRKICGNQSDIGAFSMMKPGEEHGVGHTLDAKLNYQPSHSSSTGVKVADMIVELAIIALSLSFGFLQPAWRVLCETTDQYTMTVAGMFFSLVVGYALGALPYTALNLLKTPAVEQFKVQKHRYPTRAELLKATLNVLVLFFLVMLPMIAIGAPVFELVGVHRHADLPPWRELVIHVLFFFVVEDYLNYWFHRWLHTPWAYQNIHSVHHEFNVPFAIAATYAHPAEIVILGIPTFAGPMLLGPHLFTLWVWLMMRQYEAIDIHSGYEFGLSIKQLFGVYAGVEHHDYHHHKYSGNFASIFTWCDKLYGTDDGFLEFQRKQNTI